MKFIHHLYDVPDDSKQITFLSSDDINNRSELIRTLSHKMINQYSSIDILNSLIEPCLLQCKSSLEQASDCLIDSPTCFYFQYGNDNRYFIGSSEYQYVFHDSEAYMNFYHHKHWDQKIYHYSNALNTPQAFNLICRQQYGHFLYDDVMPLFSYLYRNRISKFILNVFYSKRWQLTAISSLIYLFNFEVKLFTHQNIASNHIFNIGGRLLLSSHPNCSLNWNRDLPWIRTKNTLSKTNQIIYLSRLGFDKSMQRITNRDQMNHFCNLYAVKVISPELYDLKSIVSMLSFASVIIADPGTTPLIAALFSTCECPVIVLQSTRTLTQCNLEFVYSGWKYHLPWSHRFHYLFCQSDSPQTNPFSDSISVPTHRLSSLLESVLAT